MFLEPTQTKLQTAYLLVSRYTKFSQILPFFLGEGAGSHETQASLEPAMWLRLALILLPPAPKLQDYMHVYLCSASNSGFFGKSVLNMWQSQVTAIFNEILEQSAHSARKPDFSPKLIRPHKKAPMHSSHTDTHQKCSWVVALSLWPISVSIWELGLQ